MQNFNDVFTNLRFETKSSIFAGTSNLSRHCIILSPVDNSNFLVLLALRQLPTHICQTRLISFQFLKNILS